MQKATPHEALQAASRLTTLRAFADTVPPEALPTESVLNAAIAQEAMFEAADLNPETVIDTGMPADRAARIAARRAFVEMKQIFIRAVAHFEDRKGQWLREQVRLANDPLDLWLLRGPVLAALRENDSNTRLLRADLYRGLDSLFPDAYAPQAAMVQPELPEPWAIWAQTPAHHGLRR